jgi:hypothetical protein
VNITADKLTECDLFEKISLVSSRALDWPYTNAMIVAFPTEK